MSTEAVYNFLNRVNEDAQLQEELAQALQTDNRSEAVAQLGARHGFEFTADEIQQEMSNRVSEFEGRQQADELSDEELEAVAGGATPSAVVSLTINVSVPATIELTRRIPPIRRW